MITALTQISEELLLSLAANRPTLKQMAHFFSEEDPSLFCMTTTRGFGLGASAQLAQTWQDAHLLVNSRERSRIVLLLFLYFCFDVPKLDGIVESFQGPHQTYFYQRFMEADKA